MKAATALFAERGLHGTRIEDITERADIAKGGFYNHFPSKESVAAEVLAAALAELRASCDDSRASLRDERALPAAHARFFEAHAQHALLLHQARGSVQLDPRKSEPLVAVLREHLLWLGRAAVETMAPEELGGLTDETAYEVGAAFAGAFAGYRSFRIGAGLPADGGPLTDVVLAATRAAYAGCMARTPRP